MGTIDEAFYRLVVAERDYERVRAIRAELELELARKRIAELEVEQDEYRDGEYLERGRRERLEEAAARATEGA